MLERHVEKYLTLCLKRSGIEVRKVSWIGRRHAPDRLVLIFGGIWIELKRPRVTAKDGQAREHERMRAAGMDVRVLNTIEAVDAFIVELEERLWANGSHHANTKS